MSEAVETTMPLKSFYAAFVAAQSAMEGAIKGSVNPAFRSKYADLGAVFDACREALNSNGIGIMQMPATRTDEAGHWMVTMTTRLVHVSGEHFEPPPLVLPVMKNDPHGVGSAITYARRYHLASIVGVCPEDDDGNGAVGIAKGAAEPQRGNNGRVPIGTAKLVAQEEAHLVNENEVTDASLAIGDCLSDGDELALVNIWRKLGAETQTAVWTKFDAPTRRRIKAILAAEAAA